MTLSNVQSISAVGARIELRRGRAWLFGIVRRINLGHLVHTTS
jgi:hypothetical protein